MFSSILPQLLQARPAPVRILEHKDVQRGGDEVAVRQAFMREIREMAGLLRASQLQFRFGI